MNELSVPYVESLCSRYERITDISMKRRRFDRVIRLLKTLSSIRYKFHLGFRNSFIEERIKELSENVIKTALLDNKNEKSVTIIDEINADYVGLMTQYLAPFISGGYQILYIYEQIEHKGDVRSHLMQSLQSYDKAIVKEIPASKKGFAKSQWIYNEVCAFGSRKVLMNFGEWAIEHCVACYALPKGIVKYHINACDHTFWAGASCADYSFEFRHYGANLTYYERGLRKDQIVYMPFYPVMNDVPFEGFPEICNGKFIFLSGGAAYKVVDEEKTFFRLCKRVLDECPNAIILYAGANAGNIGNSVLTDGIEEFGMQGRFISIGYRNDMIEVFRHCDVFLDTYPIGGGVMCQFAAQCSKPIVNFRLTRMDESVAQKAECHFTYYTEDDFVSEAVRLYKDNQYRQQRGGEMKNAVVTKAEFDEALLSFISDKVRAFPVKWDDSFVAKTLSTEDAINYNNKALFVFYYFLFKNLGKDSIWLMPRNFVSFVLEGIKRKVKKIIKN